MRSRGPQSPFPRARAALTLCLVGLVVVGCGSSPQPSPTPLTLTASDLDEQATRSVEDVRAAVETAGAVHVRGTYTAPPPLDEDGEPVASPDQVPPVLTLDLHGTAHRSTATLETGPISAHLLRDGPDVYAQGNAAFAESLGEPLVAKGWVRYDADHPALAPWLPLTDPPGLLASILAPRPDVQLVEGPARTSGTPGVPLQITARGAHVGTLQIAPDGPPLPRSLAVSDLTGTADLTFTDWGQEADLDLPEGAPGPLSG